MLSAHILVISQVSADDQVDTFLDGFQEIM